MKNSQIFLSIAVFIVVSTSVFVYLNPIEPVAPVEPHYECKEDSLQKVINQMEVDLEMFDDGWDYKEKRYEEVLFEYEYALDHLKNYYPDVYRDIHRILAHKESYSREDEKENKKRLKIKGNKW
jgi:hypothetical protein